MAFRENLPSIAKISQAGHVSTTQHNSPDFGDISSTPPRHKDHFEIVRNLDILAETGLDVEYFLPFLIHPSLGASLYLLNMIYTGCITPAYLIDAQTVPKEHSGMSGTALGSHRISAPHLQPESSRDTDIVTAISRSRNALILPRHQARQPQDQSPMYEQATIRHTSFNDPPAISVKSSTPNLRSVLAGSTPVSCRLDSDGEFSRACEEGPSHPDHCHMVFKSSALSNSKSTVAHPQPRQTDAVPCPPLATEHTDPVSEEFHHYSGPGMKEATYQSPCPYCFQAYGTHYEFVNHINAVHEQPRTFVCTHPVQGPNSCYQTLLESELKEHHTKVHSKYCTMPSCFRLEGLEKPHAKSIWGCWICDRQFNLIDLWAKHHMEDHTGCVEEDVSFNILVQNLLKQDKVKLLWSRKLRQLFTSTGRNWEFDWPQASTRSTGLIDALETGFYRQQNIFKNDRILQRLIEYLFDVAQKKPLPANPSNKRAAPSPPPPPTTIDTMLPRALQYRSSRNFPTGSLRTARDDTLQSVMAQATIDHMRPVRRQNPNPASNGRGRIPESQM